MCLKIDEVPRPLILSTYGKYLIAGKRMKIRPHGINAGFFAVYQAYKYKPKRIIPGYGILIKEEQTEQIIHDYTNKTTGVKRLGYHLESHRLSEFQPIQLVISQEESETRLITSSVLFHKSWIQQTGLSEIVVKKFIIPNPLFMKKHSFIECTDEDALTAFNDYIAAFNAMLRTLRIRKERKEADNVPNN